MRCSKCSSESLPGTRFCAECGTAFPAKCLKCGAEYAAPAKFCRDCGTALDAKARPAKPVANEPAPLLEEHDPSASEGERKTVTALFADIKGSMEMIENLDPEEARAIVDPALQLMIEAVRRYGGYVAQSTGDGIFAVFGAPIAIEDHPQHALYAALRMQRDLRNYSNRLRERGEPPVTIRIGLNVGEVVVRTIKKGEIDTEYLPIGHSPLKRVIIEKTEGNPFFMEETVQVLLDEGAHRALDAVKRILLGESLNQPLIVVFEDLHWIDGESQAFVVSRLPRSRTGATQKCDRNR